MFKIFFWLGLLGVGIFVGGQVIPIYYNNLKIQNTFEGTILNLGSQDESNISKRIPDLLDVQGVDLKELPDEFFKNLIIHKEDGKLKISSKYHVVLWLLGEPLSVDPGADYSESDVAPMDKLRLRARMDFDFSPFAESP